MTYGATSGADPLSIGTAWLYSRFASGSLTVSGPSVISRPYETAADQGKLQQAIWWLEGEKGDPSFASPAGGPNNVFVQLAIAAVGGNNLDVRRDAVPGQFGVYVLNLIAGSAQKQDQLWWDSSVTVTVPDGGTTSSLLGFALVSLFIGRRRLCHS